VFIVLSKVNAEADYKKLYEFAKQIKSNMYGVMETPYMSVVLYAIVGAGCFLFILIKFNDGLERYFRYSSIPAHMNCRYVWAKNYVGFGVQLWHIVIVYGMMFLQLLFCWWAWGKPHDNGTVFKVLSPGLAIIILHQLRLSNKDAKISSAGIFSCIDSVF
jgi:hypothetical protein